MQIKLATEKDLEKCCENLKEQNERLLIGLEAMEDRINNLYGLLREYYHQKEKLLEQNTKLLAICIVIFVAHIITAVIDQSYRSTIMFYFLMIVSGVYVINYAVRKIKRKDD